VPIWIVRHAQSRSNAGLPTTGPADNDLTEIGQVQARCVAEAIATRPDLIVTSPYLRTHLTAVPLMHKFPTVPVAVWPIQEFTYLTLADQPTTPDLRQPLSQAYWQRCDPDYVDGTTAESFNQLMARVRLALQQFQQQSGDTIVFTHSLFIKAMLWQIWAAPTVIDAIAMRRFQGLKQAIRVPNAAIFNLEFRQGILYWSTFSIKHLPPEWQTAAPDRAFDGLDSADQPA
jgi:broad specificity phosphatase PhoE